MQGSLEVASLILLDRESRASSNPETARIVIPSEWQRPGQGRKELAQRDSPSASDAPLMADLFAERTRPSSYFGQNRPLFVYFIFATHTSTPCLVAHTPMSLCFCRAGW